MINVETRMQYSREDGSMTLSQDWEDEEAETEWGAGPLLSVSLRKSQRGVSGREDEAIRVGQRNLSHIPIQWMLLPWNLV